MKRGLYIILIGLLTVGCASSGATPPPTLERPKAPTVVIVINPATATTRPTATDAPTYTPIPSTFTLTPTRESRSLSTPGKIVGAGDAVVTVVGSLPDTIKASHDSSVVIYLMLPEERLLPIEQYVSGVTGVSAIKVVGTGAWTIEFVGPTTPTRQQPTVRASLVATRIIVKALAPTVAVVPTKKPTAIIIPTVFIPPTDVPPPAACCKHCTPGKSKACGDTCIPIANTCRTAPGCACNG